LRKSPIILVGFCAWVLAGCASHAPPGPSPFTENYRPPRDENFNGGPNAMLLKYDANHDGSLTRAELAAGLKAEFDSYDTKHTGCLDADQVGAINAARIAQDKSTASPLQDWNQDGCIDLKEFSTAANSLFDELDKNGDGTITPLEFKPRPPGAPAAPGRGERRPRGGRPPGQ
jgi:Ca2+-binding EF-hand superfamily protein